MTYELLLVCSHRVDPRKPQPIGRLLDDRKPLGEVESVEAIVARLIAMQPSDPDKDPTVLLEALRTRAGAMYERDTQVRFRESSWRTTRSGAQRLTQVAPRGASYGDLIRCRRTWCGINPRPSQQALGALMTWAANDGITEVDVSRLNLERFPL